MVFMFFILIVNCVNLSTSFIEKMESSAKRKRKLSHLEVAIKNGNLSEIEEILTNDPRKAFLPLKSGEIPLIYAVKQYDENADHNDDFLDMIRILINSGADIDAKDNSGYNAFMRLIEDADLSNMGDIVSFFIESGASISKELDKAALNDLFVHVIYSQESRVIQEFIDAGADMDLKDEGFILLELAILLSEKMEEDSEIGDSDTESDNINNEARGIEVLNILLLNGMDINKQDDKGNTVLHFAINRNLPETVRFLISLNIDKTLVNAEGKTAIDIAQAFGEKEIEDLLK